MYKHWETRDSKTRVNCAARNSRNIRDYNVDYRLCQLGDAVQHNMVKPLGVRPKIVIFFFAMQRHTRVTAKTQEVKDAMNNDPPYDAFLIHLLVLQLLVTKYGNDPYFTWLLDNTRIHILPSMNPDGFEVSKEGHCESGPGR